MWRILPPGESTCQLRCGPSATTSAICVTICPRIPIHRCARISWRSNEGRSAWAIWCRACRVTPSPGNSHEEPTQCRTASDRRPGAGRPAPTCWGGADVRVGKLGPVRADPGQLGQVLTALVDNAIRYRHPTGRCGCRSPRNDTTSWSSSGCRTTAEASRRGSGARVRHVHPGWATAPAVVSVWRCANASSKVTAARSRVPRSGAGGQHLQLQSPDAGRRAI